MRRLPWYSAALYMLGVLIGLYTVWPAVEASKVVLEATRFGQLRFFDEPYMIVSYFAEQFGTWLVYTLAVLALGRILHVMDTRYDDTLFDDELDLFDDEDDTDGVDASPEAGRGGNDSVDADDDEVKG